MNQIEFPFFLVDAFALEPVTGNAAGVVILPGEIRDEAMQKIATEVNHPETAFLKRLEENWSLRWFTPTTEVNLCGHATLAAAWVLFETRGVVNAEFQTRSGPLHSLIQDRMVLLDFPRQDPQPIQAPSDLARALFPAGQNDKAIVGVWQGGEDWFVELSSPEGVVGLSPDLEGISRLGKRGLVVTAAGKPAGEKDEVDFVSRFFAPQSGVPEDPVTGSAHCSLAPFWAGRLKKNKLLGKQCSSRGGVVGVEVLGKRVILSGKAFTTVRGNFFLPQSVTRGY